MVMETTTDLVVVGADRDAMEYTSGSKDGWMQCTFCSMTDEIEKKEQQRSGACGFDRDCTPPRITNHGESETPDGFSINDNVFVENQETISTKIQPYKEQLENR